MISYKFLFVFMLSVIYSTVDACPCDDENPCCCPTGIFPVIQTVFVCENRSKALSCPKGQRLTIVGANYGRLNGNICTQGPIQTTNCPLSTSLNVVIQSCNEQASCTITASNSVFGDPCAGTYKYLQVSYYCSARRLVCRYCGPFIKDPLPIPV